MEFILPAGLLLILSAVSPVLVQYIVSRSWSKNTKTLVALGVSIVVAVIYGLVTGDISLAFTSVQAFITSTVPAVGIAYAIQQAIFNTMFKGSVLADKLGGASDDYVDDNNLEIPGQGLGEVTDDEVYEDESIVLEQD